MKKNIYLSMFSLLIIIIIVNSVGTSKQNDPISYKLASNPYENIPYELLTVDYTLEDAKSDGCVVFENSQLTSGDEVWQKFIEKTGTGQKASIRLAYYYTLDPQNVSEELYEKVKDDYPALYIKDLNFDGETYRLYYTENEQEYEYEYPYLMRYVGTPRSGTATFSQYVSYFLVRDKNITFEQIERSWYSSHSRDWVDCVQVYMDLNR